MTRPDLPAGEPGAEVPGDTNAPDIVGPTGEEMPVQEHDEVGPAGPPKAGARDPNDGKDVPTRSNGVPS